MIAYRSSFKGETQSDFSKTFTATFKRGASPVLTSAYRFFYNNSSFDEDVIIGDRVGNCYQMLYRQYGFAHNVTIGDNVSTCYYMFDSCGNYVQSNIYIPESVRNVAGMFNNCGNLSTNIYFIGNSSGINANSMIAYKNNSKRVNIFCSNEIPFTGNNYKNSIIQSTLSYTKMSDNNGYYNPAYNIYIYNNYVGT